MTVRDSSNEVSLTGRGSGRGEWHAQNAPRRKPKRQRSSRSARWRHPPSAPCRPRWSRRKARQLLELRGAQRTIQLGQAVAVPVDEGQRAPRAAKSRRRHCRYRRGPGHDDGTPRQDRRSRRSSRRAAVLAAAGAARCAGSGIAAPSIRAARSPLRQSCRASCCPQTGGLKPSRRSNRRLDGARKQRIHPDAVFRRLLGKVRVKAATANFEAE